MAAPRGRNFVPMAEGMQERNAMEAEMNRFEQEIQTGQDDEDSEDEGDYAPAPPIVPPGIPQALSVLGTPDPSLMNLRFPAPPVMPPPTAAGAAPTTAPMVPAGAHPPPPPPPPPHPSGAPMGFPRMPAPAPPSTIAASTQLEPTGSYGQPGSTGDQSSSQPFPPGVQQVPGDTSQMTQRPAFVPHQVRVHAPGAAPHRPPMYEMEQQQQQQQQHHHQPQMRHPPPQGFVPAMGGPLGPYSGPPQHHQHQPPHHHHHGMPRGPAVGPMMPPGYPEMHPRPMRHHSSPTVIQAKPTIYSAKPVKFSQTKRAEMARAETAGNITTPKPEYSAPPQAVTQTPAFTPAAVPQSQAPAQMYAGMPQHAPADYSTVQPQQPQQQQQQTEAAAGSSGTEQKKKEKKKKFIRTAASTVWEDESLLEWDPNDFRIFCGDLGNEVTDDLLTKVFGRYPSFTKAKVVRDKRTSKSKGYGFVSFKDPNDFVQAMREWNGKYVGNRPIKLRKSTWKDRNLDTYKKKQKEKQRLGLR